MGLVGRVCAWVLGGRSRVCVRVLVLGLDRSGKSALLASLRAAHDNRDSDQGLMPQQAAFQSEGVSLTACEVGGAARHRALWERHYRSSDAVVFVVDSADHLRLVVAREELELLCAHPDMFGRRVPLLVFANKSDAPHALAPAQVAAALGLERITDKPWHICASCALSGEGVSDGVAWLARQLRDARRPPSHA